MTFSLIDQALNVVMTGLVYGSEMWIACAFGLFVATREPERKRDIALQQSVHLTVDQGEIEIIIVEQRSNHILSRAIAPEQKATKKLQRETSQKTSQKISQKATEKAKSCKAKPAAEAALKPMCLSQKMQEVAASAPILCEPVNWKLWKVADLRKASMAKVCGVRIRPIGSRRNLSKADLIAQYEQQMRRLTKSPMKRTRKEEVA